MGGGPIIPPSLLQKTDSYLHYVWGSVIDWSPHVVSLRSTPCLPGVPWTDSLVPRIVAFCRGVSCECSRPRIDL